LGQKVHPIGFRLGYNKDWKSKWFAENDFSHKLNEDLNIRRVLKKRFKQAGISRIEIERPGDRIKIVVHTARPGILIGKKGKEIEKLKGELAKSLGKPVDIKVVEIKFPQIEAQLVAEAIALQLEKRTAFRRAMKRAIDAAMKTERVGGIKVMCSGRLNGVEIARSERYLVGRLPLHTLKADIEYGFAEAFTTYGVIGVKVWIYKGDKTKKEFLNEKNESFF